MKQITERLIQEFRLKKLKYDFMGYYFRKKEELSFHHTIIARRDCKELHIPSEGYLKWNGVILKQSTAHEYLHRIENIDKEIFYLVTSELIDENIKGKLDIDNLKRIRVLLEYFEKEHCGDRLKNHKPLIKEEYVKERVRIDKSYKK